MLISQCLAYMFALVFVSFSSSSMFKENGAINFYAFIYVLLDTCHMSISYVVCFCHRKSWRALYYSSKEQQLNSLTHLFLSFFVSACSLYTVYTELG